MELKLKNILKIFPLRVAITDYCNLKCFFCSNEGMIKQQRNSKHIDIKDFEYLINILAENNLKQISLTGGEPTLHPKLEKILEIITRSNIKNTFFHTNGIELNQDLIDCSLKEFSKIAVSIHALDYTIWHKITCGSKDQYNKLLSNLELLGHAGYEQRLEIKHVPMYKINTSDKIIKNTLDLCAKYKFKFKFLNFEPIEKTQQKLIVPIESLIEKLKKLGCKPIENEKEFRGQMDYLPINWYEYKDTSGVAIEIGCGDKNVCKACYKSNEIFLNPNLELKPCHIHPHIISLKEFIKKRDKEKILEKIVESRIFLYSRPGENRTYWRQKIK